MKLRIILSMVFTWCALSCQAVSIDQPVFSDTFEAYAPGALTTAGGWTTVDPSSLKTKRKIEVMVDSGNLMGGGTANQILFFQNIADDPVTYDTFFSADGLSTDKVIMVSFDFYEPPTISGGFSVSIGGNPSAAYPINSFSLTDGAIGPSGSYTLSTVHHLDVVFNEAGETVDYDDPAGGVSSLATGLMDIWIDQVRVAAGVTQGRDASPSAQLASMHFKNAESQVEIYLDNVEVMETSAGIVHPPVDLLITNLVLSADTATVEWNELTDRYILIASGVLTGMSTNGMTVASGTAPTNAASFSYDASTGFFRLQKNIAAVEEITSPSLFDAVKEQSTVPAPTNRVYDTETEAVIGIQLPGQTFAVSELSSFINLESLSLEGSSLTGLDSLSFLSNLTWLNLSSNQFTSVGLPGLPDSLQALNLEDNLITDLSMVEPLVHLRWLDLENNQITDLSSIVTNAANGGLGDGDELWLRGNSLSASASNQIVTLETSYKVKVVY